MYSRILVALDGSDASRCGLDAAVIVQQANQWRANLIVMGSHARAGFVGHNTAEVLANSDVPVLMVRAPRRLAGDLVAGPESTVTPRIVEQGRV
jgi:nucleotide-binding universal stress UspA family protein